MVCYITCAISSGFIVASLATMINTHKNVLISNFVKTLTPEQGELYQEIVKYRLNIYIQGFVLGLILGLIYLYAMNNKKKEISLTRYMCTFTAIALGTQYLYYTLMPKPNWMLPHLDSKESIQQWHEVYKYLKTTYHMGFFVGAIGFCLLAYAFHKSRK